MSANRITDLEKFALEQVWRPYQSKMGYERRLAAHPRYACAFFVGLFLTAGWLDRVLP